MLIFVFWFDNETAIYFTFSLTAKGMYFELHQ